MRRSILSAVLTAAILAFPVVASAAPEAEPASIAAPEAVPASCGVQMTDTRVSGTDRYGTAQQVASWWRANTSYPPFSASLASGETPWDGLVAGEFNQPLLLTKADRLPGNTLAGLRALDAPRFIDIFGGTSAVSANVESQLRSEFPYVLRTSGTDRYSTAAKAAQNYTLTGKRVYVARGDDWQSAIQAAALAGRDGVPVLLISGTKVPSVTATELTRLKPSQMTFIGKVTNEVVYQLSGYLPAGVSVTHYEQPTIEDTNAEVIRYNYQFPSALFIVTSQNWPDAMSVAAAAGAFGAPIMLAKPTGLTTYQKNVLGDLLPEQLVIVGGTASVPQKVIDDAYAVFGCTDPTP